jgi:hypothetical protein
MYVDGCGRKKEKKRKKWKSGKQSSAPNKKGSKKKCMYKYTQRHFFSIHLKWVKSMNGKRVRMEEAEKVMGNCIG